MSLSETEIAAIRGSFAELRPDAGGAAASFYRHLFRIAPETRALFRGDMEAQGAKLMGTLGVVVGQLHALGAVLPAVRALGRRHVGYGVRPEHYVAVGEALDAMLAERLTQAPGMAPGNVRAARAAWGRAYLLLSGVMIAAAADEPEAVPG